MLKKLNLLLLLAITLLGACAIRGDNSNNNNSGNNNNSNSNNNNAPIGWVLVGEADISGAEAATPILKFYNSIPYVAFIDDPYTPGASKIRVMKYVVATDTWENIGTAFSADSSYLAFEIDSTNGYLYVAYSNGTTTPVGKITVQKYDGVSWNEVGAIPITSSEAVEQVAITLRAGTIPYVAFYDTDSDTVVVKKYTGGVWSLVATGLAAEADSVSLASDDNNVFLGTVRTTTKLINIKKYNSSDAETVIDVSTITHELSNLTIFFDNDHLYFSAVDLDNSNKIMLKSYDTLTPSWSNVGTSAYISDGEAGAPSMYVKSNGTSDDVVYVAYRDHTTTIPDYASVKFCLDNSPAVACANLGGLGFSNTAITSISLSYDDGHPYVAYINTTTDRIEVRKY